MAHVVHQLRFLNLLNGFFFAVVGKAVGECFDVLVVKVAERIDCLVELCWLDFPSFYGISMQFEQVFELLSGWVDRRDVDPR